MAITPCRHPAEIDYARGCIFYPYKCRFYTPLRDFKSDDGRKSYFFFFFQLYSTTTPTCMCTCARLCECPRVRADNSKRHLHLRFSGLMFSVLGRTDSSLSRELVTRRLNVWNFSDTGETLFAPWNYVKRRVIMQLPRLTMHVALIYYPPGIVLLMLIRLRSEFAFIPLSFLGAHFSGARATGINRESF